MLALFSLSLFFDLSSAIPAANVKAAAFTDNFQTNRTDIWDPHQEWGVEHADSVPTMMLFDHLHLNYSMTDDTGATYYGLYTVQDNHPCIDTPGSCCDGSQCADVASGHLGTVATYGYGTYTIKMKAPRQTKDGAPKTLACFTVYISSPVHNEIDICFYSNTSQMVCAYFNPTEVRFVHDLTFDPTDQFRNYQFVWTATKLSWFIDGKLVESTTGTPSVPIPTEAAPIRVVFRPLDTPYEGPASFQIASISYQPA